MAISNYIKGTEVRLSASFVIAGVATDPSTVTFRVKDPTNTETTYTSPDVVKDGVGAYHLDIYLGASGTWWYRVEGTGSCTVAAENQMNVKQSHF